MGELSAKRVFSPLLGAVFCPYVMYVFVPGGKNNNDPSFGHKHPQAPTESEKRRVHVHVSPRVHIRQRRKVA